MIKVGKRNSRCWGKIKTDKNISFFPSLSYPLPFREGRREVDTEMRESERQQERERERERRV
jgi:hypothetical protein